MSGCQLADGMYIDRVDEGLQRVFLLPRGRWVGSSHHRKLTRMGQGRSSLGSGLLFEGLYPTTVPHEDFQREVSKLYSTAIDQLNCRHLGLVNSVASVNKQDTTNSPAANITGLGLCWYAGISG
jgi:hypothetical protein